MKTRLSLTASLLLALSLTACGNDSTDTAQDPAASSSPAAPTDPGTIIEDPTGTVPFTEIGVFTGSDEGGHTEMTATPLDSPEAVTKYVGQFKGTALADQIRTAVDANTGGTPYAQVVAIGCERPDSISVTGGPDSYAIDAVVPKSDKQCLVAMTSVAVVTVP